MEGNIWMILLPVFIAIPLAGLLGAIIGTALGKTLAEFYNAINRRR